MEKHIIFLFGIIFIALFLSISFVSSDNPPKQSSSIHSRGQDWDLENTPQGFKKTQYMGAVNMPDSYGNYQPYTEVTTFTMEENQMIIEWWDKKVVFEFYDKKNNKKEKYKDKTSTKKNDLDFKNTKKTNKGNYYFTHNMTKDKNKQPDKFGYDIVTTNVECDFKNKKLICGEMKMDFSNEVDIQGLDIIYNKSSGELEMSGNLTKIGI